MHVYCRDVASKNVKMRDKIRDREGGREGEKQRDREATNMSEIGSGQQTTFESFCFTKSSEKIIVSFQYKKFSCYVLDYLASLCTTNKVRNQHLSQTVILQSSRS